jgi:hypothetical protein
VVDELSRGLVPDELWALWMNWAVEGLIDWSRAVVDGLARQICQGTGVSAVLAAEPELERDAGGVLVVLLGGAVWMGTATAPAAEPPRGPGWVCRSHGNAVCGHDHRVCWCVTNCVTITAYDHGLP